MDGSNWPIVLIEGVMVLGGALAFGWWQLRSVERDRQETLRQRAEQATRPAPPDPDPDADSASNTGPVTRPPGPGARSG